jgi:hypothetical protein
MAVLLRRRRRQKKLPRAGGTSVDAVLTRELEDVISADAEELAGLSGLSLVMLWPAIWCLGRCSGVHGIESALG